MNRKISLGLCISVVVIAVAATFALTMIFSKQIYNSIISNISQRSRSYESAEEINRLISNYFYGDLDEYNNNLASSLAQGYVSGLNDENSYYMTATEYDAYMKKLDGGIIGVGIESAYDHAANQLLVSYVYEGSSAESEGLRAGDIITAVDNITVTRSNYRKIQEMFFADRMKPVSIEYERDSVTKVASTMSTFSIPSVTSREESGVGYIRISGFFKNTADELKTALEGFKSASVTSVVIDLRNTSDGTIAYSAKAIDVIVPNINGNIAVARDKSGNVKETFSAESSGYTMKFAVLINGNTKGPAELFACDLRDISQAQLVGTLTAGSGTMQEIYTLDDGGALNLTVALVVPKNGDEAVYNNLGVSPTMEVTVSVDDASVLLLPDGEDNQLTAAVNMIKD